MAYGSISVDQINNTTGYSLGAGNATQMKNRIINGAMVIDQRNGGGSVTPTNLSYTLDRWAGLLTQSSKFTIQQNAGSVTPPVNFSKYLGVTSSSAYSLGSTDRFGVYQVIEGFNGADLGWGTANAKTITLSFQVYSSLTGTFSGAIRSGSGTDTSYVFTYSIPLANTWTSVAITIPGCTSGTWASDNSQFAYINFSLGVGSSYSAIAGSWTTGNYWGNSSAVNVVGTSGATWYITGVQFEVGSVSTGYEFRHYGMEIYLCQRYYQVYSDQGNGNFCHIWSGYVASDPAAQYIGSPLLTMRAAPTGTFINTNSSAFGSPAFGSTTSNFFRAYASPTGQNNRAYFQFNCSFSAEL